MRTVLLLALALSGCTSASGELPGDGLAPGDSSPTASPTWGECRTAHLAGLLDGEVLDACDALHRQAPQARELGLRWIVLDDSVEDVEALFEPRMPAINDLYAPAGLSFATADLVWIDDPVAQKFVETESFSLEELASDIAQYLALDSDQPDDVLDAFVAHMGALGVDQEALDALSLDTVWDSRTFFNTMARALPDAIMVTVGTLSDDPGQGGVSHPPGYDSAALTSDIVGLSISQLEDGLAVLPHELGHYFGLAHPHSSGAVTGGEAVFQLGPGIMGHRQRFGDESVAERLTDRLGEGIQGPLGDNFVPYDASDDEVLDADGFRSAAAIFWDRPDFTYRGDQESFADVADFVDWTAGGDDALLKNFVDRPQGAPPTNNCSDATGEVRCRYRLGAGPDEVTIQGSDPFLADSLSAEEGTQANLMSYIRIQERSEEDLHALLSQAQLELIGLHANAPTRLSLRNRLQD